jgi:hypothetical protein
LTTQAPQTVDAASGRSRRWAAWLLGLLLLGGLAFALYTAFMLWYSYSEGERAGVLQKFSKRGWICKTYEGELALYVVGGVAPQIWHFSVRDEQVIEDLYKAVGQQVRLHYKEHRGLPTSCFGETDYFATRFEVIGPVVPEESASGLAVTPMAPEPPTP